MSNDDFRRELNDAFDGMAGSPSSALHDRVRSSISQAPEERGPYWIAAVAATLLTAAIVGVLFVYNPLNRHPVPLGPGPSPSPTASASPAASPRPSPSPTATPSSGPPYVCASSAITSSRTPLSAYIDAVRTGAHPGYDRLTIEFQNGQPGSIQLTPQSGTVFNSGGGRGGTYTLAGQNGVNIVIRGADAHTAYSGPTDFKTGYSALAEVRMIQDFEGNVQYALGISGPACYRATILINPTRLVIDIQAS